MSISVNSTTHPVIVNGDRISKPSEYLSFEGDIAVNTAHPIIVDGKLVQRNEVRSAASGADARLQNLRMRIAANNDKIAVWQNQIAAINQRVAASGRTIGAIDSNTIKGLQMQITAAQKRNEVMNAQMARFSSVNGKIADDDFYGAEGTDFYGVDGAPLMGNEFDNKNIVAPDGLTAPDSSSVLPAMPQAAPAPVQSADPIAAAPMGLTAMEMGGAPVASVAPVAVAPVAPATPPLPLTLPAAPVSPVATPITATATPARNHPKWAAHLQRQQMILGRLQARVNSINTRVQTSGQPISARDTKWLEILNKRIANVQQKIQRLQGLMATSSAEGTDDEFFSVDAEHFSYIDKGNSSDVKSFQDWLDKKGIKWVKATNSARNNGSLLNKGSGYGTYGPSTANAYAVYGSQWEAQRIGDGAPVQVVTQGVPSVPSGQQPTVAQMQQQKAKGVVWDKLKRAWVTSKNLGITDMLLDKLIPKKNTASIEAGGLPADDSGSDGKKTLKKVLIIGGVVVGAFILYKVISKKKGK